MSFHNDPEALGLWDRYVAPALGKRVARQFAAAARATPDAFWSRFVQPNLFRPDLGTYVPVAVSAHVPGRNHWLAESIACDDPAYSGLGRPARAGIAYFTNILRIGHEPVDGSGDGLLWERPMDRVVLGDHQVFTFEFDVRGQEFLATQLGWLRSRKNYLDCPMGDLYKRMCQWADFAGVTVAFSGNKSLHIHIVFKTGLADSTYGLAGAPAIRRALMEHWDTLHPIVLESLGVPDGIEADRSLRAPEAYRRLPNGARGVEKDNHVLGIPVGTMVPQLTLWERWTERAAAGADTMFFRPGPFFSVGLPVMHAVPGARQARPAASSFKDVLAPDAMAYCEGKLAALYPGYPKLEALRFERGAWTAYFRNSPSDRNPSSVMRGDHHTVMVVGKDASTLSPRKLPYPLSVMMKMWVAEFRRLTLPEWEEVEIASIAPAIRGAAHEEEFARAATDQEAASRQLRRALRKAVRAHPRALVCAPEGIRKTTSLFEDHHRTQGAIAAQSGSDLSMYAFADYAAAEAKCAAFNFIQQQRRERGAKTLWHGIVIPSFSRAYARACDDAGVAPLSAEDAARAGFATLWDAMAAIQPHVIDVLKAAHRALWAEIGSAKPVFFTVHDVAQRWTLTTPTRVMWAREFWIGQMRDPSHIRSCRRATALGLLVHDEVDKDDLLVVRRAEVIEWIDGLRSGNPKVWTGRRGNLAAQMSSYLRHLSANPFPQVAGTTCAVSFHAVREIVALGSVQWDEVTTRCSGEYGEAGAEDDIYAARAGRRWRIATRGWWSGVAERVLVLTTEAVPTEIARRLAPQWVVHELATPLLPRDNIDTFPKRGVTGGGLVRVISDYRAAHGAENRVVISNRAKALANTITHSGAKGSNEFIGHDLAQTMTFFPPDQYEELEALNAWAGRTDLIRLQHIDQLNQSAGRNLGFRRRGDVRHDLLINRRLLGLLMGEALARCRYDLRVHLGRDQRYAIRVRA